MIANVFSIAVMIYLERYLLVVSVCISSCLLMLNVFSYTYLLLCIFYAEMSVHIFCPFSNYWQRYKSNSVKESLLNKWCLSNWIHIFVYMHAYIKISNWDFFPQLSHQGSPPVSSLSLSPGDLHDQGIKLGSPVLQADSLPAELPWKSILSLIYNK